MIHHILWKHLWFSIKLDLDIWGRNCDRTVEWSPTLEGLDELGALLLRDSLEVKVQPNCVEEAQHGPNRLAGIEHPTNDDCGCLHRLEPIEQKSVQPPQSGDGLHRADERAHRPRQP